MKYNISGKYPVMANWLAIKKPKDGVCYVINGLTNESYCLDYDMVYFLRHLNGNVDPYKLGQKYDMDTDYIMDFFCEHLLVRTDGRKLFWGRGTYLRTMYIPKKKRTTSLIPRVYNLLLLIGWFPMLMFGLCGDFSALRYGNTFINVGGCVLACVLGGLMHEISHAMACLAYGGSLFEVGMGLERGVSMAYVLTDESSIKSRLKRVQFYAAGVEMNLMLAGVFFSLASHAEGLSACFFFAAVANTCMAIFNLSFTAGVDGDRIMSELLGLEGGVGEAKNILRGCLRNKERVKMPEKKKVIIAACVVMILHRGLLPLLVISYWLLALGKF